MSNNTFSPSFSLCEKRVSSAQATLSERCGCQTPFSSGHCIFLLSVGLFPRVFFFICPSSLLDLSPRAFVPFFSSPLCTQFPPTRISIRRTRVAARICTCNANKPRERFAHMSRARARARNVCVFERENIVPLLDRLLFRPLSLFTITLNSFMCPAIRDLAPRTFYTLLYRRLIDWWSGKLLETNSILSELLLSTFTFPFGTQRNARVLTNGR